MFTAATNRNSELHGQEKMKLNVKQKDKQEEVDKD
jgi:hypothetical protein